MGIMDVAPHVGAWIETCRGTPGKTPWQSRPPRGGVD